jgi:uridylate kinase
MLWEAILKVVLKIGGYAFPAKPNVEVLSSYAKTLRRIRKNGHQLVVVTGGGEAARLYINAARELGESEAICDIIGINVSRLNARLLIAKLGEDAFLEVPSTVEEMRKAFETGKIVILGGLQPGQSTNAVAAVTAEAINADLLINATNVDGVYTDDPRKNPNAKKIDQIKVDKLLQMMIAFELSAGGYELFDPVAVKIVKRSKIPTWIIDGRNVDNIEKILRGEEVGTQIVQ